jgi:hypothetical protein
MTTKVGANACCFQLLCSHTNRAYLFVLAVESDAANQVMDLIRDRFVNGDLSAREDESGIKVVDAEEFS